LAIAIKAASKLFLLFFSGGKSMKFYVKSALVIVSLLLSAGFGFAADVKAPAANLKGASVPSAATANENAKGKAADVKSAAKGKLVDINTATVAELKAVSGIGEAYAAKIIAGRPYANKAQLKSRKIVPATVYEQVKDLIIAKLIKK
jgi:DNA uptake protein ComE-like DNA-binding protein